MQKLLQDKRSKSRESYADIQLTDARWMDNR